MLTVNMIRRIFQWRARKRLARTRYKLDRRHYPGQFRAGFLSHLQSAHFWESDRDPAMRRLRWRRRLLKISGVVLIVVVLWGIWESVRGLSLF